MMIDGWCASRSAMRRTRSKIAVAEPGVVAQRHLPSVRLDVRLVHEVQPELVAQLGEVLVVRVVRGTDRVEVVRLHELEVATGQFGVDRPPDDRGRARAGSRRARSTGTTVDAQLVAGDLEVPEPGRHRVHLDLVARPDPAGPSSAGTAGVARATTGGSAAPIRACDEARFA